MVTIRLSRVGKKNNPLFRIVVQDKQKDPYGPALDIVGFYNPHTKPSTIELKEEKIKEWLGKGAQPSNTVWNLFLDAGLVEGKKRKSVAISNKRAAKAAEAEEDGEEAPKDDAPKEKPVDETTEAPKEEAPTEGKPEEAPKE